MSACQHDGLIHAIAPPSTRLVTAWPLAPDYAVMTPPALLKTLADANGPPLPTPDSGPLCESASGRKHPPDHPTIPPETP